MKGAQQDRFDGVFGKVVQHPSHALPQASKVPSRTRTLSTSATLQA
jgi:hypothetical protein